MHGAAYVGLRQRLRPTWTSLLIIFPDIVYSVYWQNAIYTTYCMRIMTDKCLRLPTARQNLNDLYFFLAAAYAVRPCAFAASVSNPCARHRFRACSYAFDVKAPSLLGGLFTERVNRSTYEGSSPSSPPTIGFVGVSVLFFFFGVLQAVSLQLSAALSAARPSPMRPPHRSSSSVQPSSSTSDHSLRLLFWW